MLNLLWTLLFSVLPPCASEDMSNCAWDAVASGNGQGTSFIDMGGTTWTPDASAPNTDR